MQTMTQSYTVTELTLSLKQTIEPKFSRVKVKGEISNLKRQASGHIYFTLKDNKSQLSVAFFKGSQQRVKQLPKDGDHVELKGEISIYPPRGSYQLIAREIEFLGIGELLVQFQKLKEALAKKGYFDPSIKKKLPMLPKKIGVITSPTGSVIRDILHVLYRRFLGMHILLYPVKVQGEGASSEIATALAEMNRYKLCDVIIVARGGGSLEDLWPFNEESVAHALYQSTIPVISAVGHETDVTLSDFAADVRAPTPSAAAEIVIREKNQELLFFERAQVQVKKFIQNKMLLAKQMLRRIKEHPIFASSDRVLQLKMQQLDYLKDDLDQLFSIMLEKKKNKLVLMQEHIKQLSPQENIRYKKARLEEQKNRLDTTMHYLLQTYYKRLPQIKQHLQGIDPKNLLKKGYSILFSENEHSIILSTKDIKEGESFSAMVQDGSIKAKVEGKDG